MMKRIFSLLLFLVVAFHASAAIPDMKFRRLDIRDGLSSTQVNSIFRDSKGYVWMATPYGLNRYDGYRLKVYYSQANDSLSMLCNNVADIQEAHDGHLWINHGTEYSVLDPENDSFDRHPERWLHEQGIKGEVERVYIDRFDRYWVKTYDQGLWVLDICKHSLRHFPEGDDAQQITPDMTITDITEYGNSLLMVSNDGEITCLNTLKQTVSWKSNSIKKRCALPSNGNFIRVDEQKNLWVLVEGKAYVFLRKTGRWYDSAAEALEVLGIHGFQRDMKIWDIAIGNHKQLWMATDHKGLCVVSFADKTVHHFMAAKNDETTISDNTLRKIYRDQLGRMWIATYMNGVNFYSENLFHFKNLAVGNVNTTCVDKQGNLWMGTNDMGIIHYNKTTSEQTIYNKEKGHLSSNIIVCSMAASNGSLWFGTYGGGILCYKNGHFVTYKSNGQPDGLANNNVWALCEDQWGNIWVGTLGAGLQRIDNATGKFSKPLNKLASKYIFSIQLTESGRLLVGHTEFYSWVDPKSMLIENCRIENDCKGIPPAPQTNQIIQDSRGLLWQASMTGVTVCDLKRNRTWLLDRESGLFGSMVAGLVEDARHTVWVVTMHGLSNVIPQQQPDGSWNFFVQSYNNRDGLHTAPYNQRSASLASNGHVVVGGYEGVDVINPKDLRVGQVKEMPMLSGVRIMERPMQKVPEKLSLEYSENYFTICLATDKVDVHNRSRFAYRLRGFNDQWLYTDDIKPDVSYTGLPSGSYTFEAHILEDDGTLSEEKCSLKIYISAPWYRSWWMNTIYLLLIAGLVWWLYRRNENKLRLERMKMERDNRHEIEELRQRFQDNISDELRQPFRNTFESLNRMMQRETDEQRYEEEQQVFGHVENLLEQVNKLAENSSAENKLKPQIREMEITSLDEKLVQDATNYVEDNLDNADISVETMAEALAMSRVHLYKKLTAITDLTPSEFIRQIRLRHAEQLLLKSQLSVAEVAYKVGFNNPRYFSKYFKEMYGMMPSEYKNKEE